MTKQRIALGFVAAFAAAGWSAAQAADLGAKSPQFMPAPAPYSWTGFYLGANVGYAVSDNEMRVNAFGAGGSAMFDIAAHGVMGGGQFGYNWQVGTWVFGVEADIQASASKSATNCVFTCVPGGAGAISATQELPWFGTVRGRVGTALGGLLFYYTGGFAYGEIETRISETLPTGAGTVTFNQNRTGWTAGSGVEAALGGNWVGRVEYLFVDFGTTTGSYTIGGVANTFTSDGKQHIFRVGANYRFGAVGSPPSMGVPNWAGFYAGGAYGGAVARNAATLTPGAPIVETFDVTPKGYFAGGQIGYNWQAGNWVYGIEADLQGSTQESTQTCALRCAAGSTLQIKQELPWFGTVRGRLGYSVGPGLFYLSGGWAYGGFKNTVSETVGAPLAVFSFDQNKSGYAIGGGIETPVAPLFGITFQNWTTRSEYVYIDLGTVTDNYIYNGAAHTLTTNVRNHVFRSTLSYKFGGL